MTFLRHAPRHVHHTVANAVKAQLDALNWTTDGSVPFGATKVAVRTSPAIKGTALDQGVGAGTVAITLGDESWPELEELGGPLSSQEYPLFFDVFEDTPEITTALASDIKDTLLGRFAGTSRYLQVIDQASGSAVAGWTLELTDVERATPQHSFPLCWEVVKVTAVVHFSEVQY